MKQGKQELGGRKKYNRNVCEGNRYLQVPTMTEHTSEAGAIPSTMGRQKNLDRRLDVKCQQRVIQAT